MKDPVKITPEEPGEWLCEIAPHLRKPEPQMGLWPNRHTLPPQAACNHDAN